MDRDSIKEFLRELGGENIQLVDHHDWVSTNCLLAPWTHTNGTDRNASFGVKVNDGGTSIFNCLTCKTKGPLDYLLTQLEGYTGEDYGNLKSLVGDGEFLAATLPTWESRHKDDERLGDPVDPLYLDVYEDAEDHPYLEERGISIEAARDLRLQVDPDNHGVERILFPVFSLDGGFYGFTGRAVAPRDAEPRVRDYFGLKKRLLLLGANTLDFSEHSFVILVEGLFDFAKVHSMGYPCVAAMHSALTEQQAAILAEVGKPVYVMFDNDRAGKRGARSVKKYLGQHIPLWKVRYPEGINDPGENGFTEDVLLNMIDDARLL